MTLEISDLRTSLVGPVTLRVAPGECVAIMGPSGAGKSLLLRAIADLDPNAGTVRLGDITREATGAERWRRMVALVPAESGWWSDRVAGHFERPEAARPILDRLGLADALGWEVSRLSTGERHRLAIARALALGPKALLLDEPTAALDETATAAVEGLVADALAEGAAVILVTHDVRQAARMADRRFAMDAGRLTPAEAPA